MSVMISVSSEIVKQNSGIYLYTYTQTFGNGSPGNIGGICKSLSLVSVVMSCRIFQ